ncbi:DUF1508 domain-containing protein [Streptosporangium sp. NPDC048047]|uniref:DUF1508 domain-containing protein n=1 Tax=unclassified Streptosporangium TaxID=2632669 RepID=UPI003445794F
MPYGGAAGPAARTVSARRVRESYKTTAGAVKGIESVRTNAPSPVDDQTEN